MGSKIKKGWDKYCDWCDDALEAENPAYLGDPKDLVKDGMKSIGNNIKKGWTKYTDWIEKDMDAPNPAYLGDEDEMSESIKKSIKKMVREAICNMKK